MNDVLPSLRAIAPEGFLLLGSCGAFAAALSAEVVSRRRVAFLVAAASVLAALVATLSGPAPFVASSTPFGGLLRVDGWVVWTRVLALAGLAVTLVASARSRELDAGQGLADPREDAAPEYLGLLATVTAASSFMAAANDILTAFLAIELASLPSYLLVAFRRRSAPASEAALKYVVYGSVASGVSLFGFSWLYGAARATSFSGLSVAFTQAPEVAVVGALFVLAGLAFKIAAVPFHMWCPDAYQGAPLPVAMFLSLVPKAGALVLVGRFAASLDAPVVLWAVAALAALSMTWGNVAALAQSNLRRLLAYSAIAHAGTMLLAFLVPSVEAASALVVYLAAYLFMGLAAFLAVAHFVSAGAETLDDLRGLGARAPFVSALLAVALFSLTGLPPLAGFLGKYSLFAALIAAGLAPDASEPSRVLLLGLVTLGVLNTVVSLAYYARIVKALYFDAAPTPRGAAASAAAPSFVFAPRSFLDLSLLVLLTAGTLGLGILPGRFLAWTSGWVAHAPFAAIAPTGAPPPVAAAQAPLHPLRDEGRPR